MIIQFGLDVIMVTIQLFIFAFLLMIYLPVILIVMVLRFFINEEDLEKLLNLIWKKYFD